MRVKRFTELHDIQATLPQRRTNRGRWVRFTCRDLQFDKADYFLCHSDS
ncbi:hypothetical protein PATSB16_42350 [Pandoraea thiooxydans]|nr:hypothetical protein PATSB16_42350 [Pandoraea thiooxydans]